MLSVYHRLKVRETGSMLVEILFRLSDLTSVTFLLSGIIANHYMTNLLIGHSAIFWLNGSGSTAKFAVQIYESIKNEQKYYDLRTKFHFFNYLNHQNPSFLALPEFSLKISSQTVPPLYISRPSEFWDFIVLPFS